MRLLLDTHTFLWHLTDSPELSVAAREAVCSPVNEVLVSIASCWEMTIKISLGRLRIEQPIDRFIVSATYENQMLLLPIHLRHLGVLAQLPFHHRDPFDRLLAAQSLAEDVPIVSRDTALDAYGVRRVW